MSSTGDLLASQACELERLQLRSRVWQPSGRRLLEPISADSDEGYHTRLRYKHGGS